MRVNLHCWHRRLGKVSFHATRSVGFHGDIPGLRRPTNVLPRLNPATGMGRSDTQCVTCSSIAIGGAACAGLVDCEERGAGLPVASRVQPGG